MKKSTTILLALFALISFNFLTSCSSDDDNISIDSPKYNIVGTWDLTEYKNADGEWSSMSILGYYVHFGEDKFYKTNYLGIELTGTYSYDGKDKIKVNTDVGTSFIKIHYIQGDKGEAEMYNESDPSDKIELRLKRR